MDVIVACAAVRAALLAATLDALAEPALAVVAVKPSGTTLPASGTALLASANVGLLDEAAALDSDGATGGIDAAEGVATASGELPVTEPALSWLVCVPDACPPEVLTQNCLKIDGRCA